VLSLNHQREFQVKSETTETSRKPVLTIDGVAQDEILAKLEAATQDQSFAGDRLVGVAAIAAFIDPNMSLWKAQKLLEGGAYPCWREGRVYVASRSALRRRWLQKTGTTA
jgi:hypothetical protein